MYLVDTNVFLEGLLEQEKVEDVRSFFKSVDLDMVFITDLSLHSIGIILFSSFLKDLVANGMRVLSLEYEDLDKLETTARKFYLDFDDAYQYTTAKKHGLALISFDSDFDKT